MPGMPGYDPTDPTANLIRSSNLSVKMVDAYGRTSRTLISGLGAQDLAIGENTRFTEAVGAVSNMGAYGFAETRDNDRLIVDAEVYDEAWSDASNVLYMVFQNNEGRTITYEVPAPQARFFESDGVTLIPLPANSADDNADEAIVRELILASQNVINTSFAPVNSYVFVRGSRRTRKQPLPAAKNARPTVTEPASNTGTSG